MNQPVFETTATALREKSKLRRHFRRFDMFVYVPADSPGRAS